MRYSLLMVIAALSTACPSHGYPYAHDVFARRALDALSGRDLSSHVTVTPRAVAGEPVTLLAARAATTPGSILLPRAYEISVEWLLNTARLTRGDRGVIKVTVEYVNHSNGRRGSYAFSQAEFTNTFGQALAAEYFPTFVRQDRPPPRTGTPRPRSVQ